MTAASALSIEPAEPLIPDGLANLADRAEAEGIRIVASVIECWLDRSLRFDQPGESLLAAVPVGPLDQRQAIAIGGLTNCPTVEGALRVRRFYVHPDWRRGGIARALAEHLVTVGFEQAPTIITCHAGASDAAVPFWEAMGFEPVSGLGPRITHVRRRP